MLAQVLGPIEVVGELVLALPMHGTIDFERQAQLGAVEVDDVAADRLLAAKLEFMTAAIAQQLPGRALGSGRFPTESARKLALGGRDPGVPDDGMGMQRLSSARHAGSIARTELYSRAIDCGMQKSRDRLAASHERWGCPPLSRQGEGGRGGVRGSRLSGETG